MLALIGGSILSGSLTTMFGMVFMLTCWITFFSKFGRVVLFLEVVSLTFALGLFSSIMNLFGPQGSQGNWGTTIKWLICKYDPAEDPLALRDHEKDDFVSKGK